MNIFYVDEDPVIAAQNLANRHILSQTKESAQLLSTAHRVMDGDLINKVVNGRNTKYYQLYDNREALFYKATHVNHPSAIWCRENSSNYLWLYEHFSALLKEYTYRYNKVHACKKLEYDLQSLPLNITYDIDASGVSPIPCCMPKEYIISDNPVDNYRNYYKLGKTHLHSWKKREKPHWIN